jgi:hypothetical protein
MKKFGWLLVVLFVAVPAWSAKKITVQELKDTLASMQQAKKSDAEMAASLKQVELSEQLTRPVMNSLVSLVAGPLSTEQVYVLEARSAELAPPASDLPTTAAPDDAAQKAMLDKTGDYVSKTYTQLPALSATKTTVRFQDNVEAAPQSSGMHGSAQDASTAAGAVSAFQFIHYINSTESPVVNQHGAEQLPSEKDKTPWGANKMIALQEPDPNLGTVFQEARDAGSIKWLRWEVVNGKPAAVYTFDVPKKKAHFAVNVCCFPDVDQAGTVRFSGQMGTGQTGSSPGAGGGAKGNFQTTTSWHPYKANVPYHGEFFIDPDTGIVVRMITMAELKQSEVVHQEDTRIDYAPVSVGSQALVVPVKTVINTEVVPNGDSGSAGRFSTRRTLFTSEYKDYQAAGK